MEEKNPENACKGNNPTDAPELKKKRTLMESVREFFICALQVIILTLIIINFIGRVSVVQGSSMIPSLESNNRILVNLFIYRLNSPKRGEIIVFQCPVDQKRDYIKRIIGLPGETVEIKGGEVYIDGELLEEPYLEYVGKSEIMEKITVPEGRVFVMGDNRTNSEDSRYWGAVPRKLVKGKAQLVFWPLNEFHILK